MPRKNPITAAQCLHRINSEDVVKTVADGIREKAIDVRWNPETQKMELVYEEDSNAKEDARTTETVEARSLEEIHSSGDDQTSDTPHSDEMKEPANA